MSYDDLAGRLRGRPRFSRAGRPRCDGIYKGTAQSFVGVGGSGLGQGQRFVQDLDIPGLWWATFHSRPLNDLIEDALKHNADLQTAQAALRVAYQNAEAQKGAFWPQVGGNYNSQSIKSPPRFRRRDRLPGTISAYTRSSWKWPTLQTSSGSSAAKWNQQKR